jgi:hypothetical protein
MKRHPESPPPQGPAKPDEPALCGCGLSRTFPLCDSSQLISKGREPGKLVSCGAGKRVLDPKSEPLDV